MIESRVAIVGLALLVACNSGSGIGERGADATGGGGDAPSASADASFGSDARDGQGDRPVSDGGSGPRCSVNGDCPAAQVCYHGVAATCAPGGGTCVRLVPGCTSVPTVGAGCPCLELPGPYHCDNGGAYCLPASPQDCWICRPVQ
jgi:hypothetical protein